MHKRNMMTMKKLTLTMIALLALLPAVSFAQSKTVKAPSLDIKVPQVGKLCIVTGSEINIRKSPSATAPKLMTTCYPGSDDCTLIWSGQKGRGFNSPFTASQNQVMPIIDETPEWFKVIPNEYYSIQGYISKKFSKICEVSPITPDMLSLYDSYDYENMQKPGIVKGKYAGYAIIDCNGYETAGYSVGRIIDGYLISVPVPTKKWVGFEYDDQCKRVKVKKDNETLTFYYGKEVAYIEDEYNQCLDFSKLTDQEIAGILYYLEVKPGVTSDIGDIYTNVNGQIVKVFTYDLTNSSFKVARTDVAPEVLIAE